MFASVPSTALEECVIRRLLSGVRLSLRVLCLSSVLKEGCCQVFASVSEYCVVGVCYKKVVVMCSPQCRSTVLEECVIRRLLSGV